MRTAPRQHETDVVRRVRSGDERAMRELYEAHAARVHAIALRLLGDPERAQDGSQETWIRAFTSLEGFRGDCSFSTWIYRIAVNCCLGLRRHDARRPQPTDVLTAAQPAAPATPPLLRLRLGRALQRLPCGMRRILVLHDVEGYTHEEIAARLHISPGTSKSQLSRARRRVRDELRAGSISCEPSWAA